MTVETGEKVTYTILTPDPTYGEVPADNSVYGLRFRAGQAQTDDEALVRRIVNDFPAYEVNPPLPLLETVEPSHIVFEQGVPPGTPPNLPPGTDPTVAYYGPVHVIERVEPPAELMKSESGAPSAENGANSGTT